MPQTCALAHVLAPLFASIAAIGKVPGSPNWHRRQRAARAKLRKRIRLRRAAGLSLRAKDTALLSAHHTRPTYELGMGGKRQPQQQPWKDSRNEQYWRGSWALSPRSQRSQQPRYDQVELDGKGSQSGWDTARPWDMDVSGAHRTPTVTQAVQKELTAARKADARLRRLTAEKELRAKQWEKFKAEQKRNFLKQRQQFGEDIAKLDNEMSQAAEVGKNAAEKMKLIVLQGAALAQASSAQPEQDDQEWERLMTSEEMVVEPAGFLQEAFRTAMSVGQAPPGLHRPGLAGEAAGPPAHDRLPSFGMQFHHGSAGIPSPLMEATSAHQAATTSAPASHGSAPDMAASPVPVPLATDPYTRIPGCQETVAPRRFIPDRELPARGCLQRRRHHEQRSSLPRKQLGKLHMAIFPEPPSQTSWKPNDRCWSHSGEHVSRRRRASLHQGRPKPRLQLPKPEHLHSINREASMESLQFRQEQILSATTMEMETSSFDTPVCNTFSFAATPADRDMW